MLRVLLIVFLFFAIVYVAIWSFVVRMPGWSFRGELPAMSAEQVTLRDELRGHVEMLGATIGERNVFNERALTAAEDYISATFREAGYAVESQMYDVQRVTCTNLAVEIVGTKRPDEILIVGAHYDSVYSCPGANDNGSGAAAVLALARRFAGAKPECTLRFVAFVNEEPPYFQTPRMGSVVYADACRDRGEHIVGMIALETIGYYSDAAGSQRYPPPLNWFYPSTGNFVAFVGNQDSANFVRRTVGSFRRRAKFPSQGAAIPSAVPQAGWSDHWAFWQIGVPALMVTDTAPFRYEYYHTPDDTPEKLDYDRMARVVDGLAAAIAELAGVSKESGAD